MPRSIRKNSASLAPQAFTASSVDLELLPEAALHLDASARLVTQNRLASDLLGPSEPMEASALAKALSEVEGFLDWLGGSGGESFRGRVQVRRRNGVPITVDLSAGLLGSGVGALCLLHEPGPERVALEATRYFDVAFDTAPTGMALFNTDGEYIRVNASLAAFLGRTPQELLGRRDQEFTHPDDRQADVEAAWRILQGELSTWQCEKRFIRPDGTVVWATVSLTFLRDQEGNPLSWVGQFQDVTERREAEQQLERQRRQLAEAQSLARLGSWEWDIAADRIEWSDQLCRLYGQEPGGLLTFESFMEHTHPDDHALIRQVVGDAYASGEAFGFEHRIVRPDGTVSFVYGRGEVVCDPQGVPVRMLGTGQDITDLKQAYLAVEAGQRQNRMIVESAHDSFVAIDETGKIVDWNPAAETTFGWTRSEALGRMLVDTIVRAEDRQVYLDGLKDLFRSDFAVLAGKRLEQTARHRDGHEIPVEFTISAIPTSRGLTLNAFLRDRTTQMLAESAIADARDAALDASRLKSDFLANMSHEIRTPMNGVIGMAGFLLDTELTPQQRGYASTVQTAGEALLSVINDILDFSKIEAGKLSLELTDFKIPALATEVASILGSAAQHKGLKLTTTVDDGLSEAVIGDPGRLRQILINLLGNAVKFTECGDVQLKVWKVGTDGANRMVRFEINDSGIGIADAAQDQLFQAFHQLDSSLTRTHGGTGLGLVISRQLVDLMGGEMGVASELGRGSAFWFTVPLPLAVAAISESIEPVRYNRGTGGLVLVAEDNEINQIVAVAMLEKLGYRADVVATGVDAVEALPTKDYVAVLMDCQMPLMDGFEATRRMRRDQGSAHHTPVIAMTAGAMNGDRERCMEAGMDDYISKPVRTDELGRMLHKWGLKGEISLGAPSHS